MQSPKLRRQVPVSSAFLLSLLLGTSLSAVADARPVQSAYQEDSAYLPESPYWLRRQEQEVQKEEQEIAASDDGADSGNSGVYMQQLPQDAVPPDRDAQKAAAAAKIHDALKTVMSGSHKIVDDTSAHPKADTPPPSPAPTDPPMIKRPDQGSSAEPVPFERLAPSSGTPAPVRTAENAAPKAEPAPPRAPQAPQQQIELQANAAPAPAAAPPGSTRTRRTTDSP